MSKDSAGSSAVIRHWVWHGPRDSDGTLGWFLGNWLWWRTWVVGTLVFLPVLAGLATLSYAGGFTAVFVTALAESLMYPKMMEVSPKYNVSKNY